MSTYKVGDLIVCPANNKVALLIEQEKSAWKTWDSDDENSISFQINWNDGTSHVVKATTIDLFIQYNKWTLISN